MCESDCTDTIGVDNSTLPNCVFSSLIPIKSSSFKIPSNISLFTIGKCDTFHSFINSLASFKVVDVLTVIKEV